MTNQKQVIIGIDGGGTYTRVMVSDLEGHILSYVENGASSIKKDIHANQNVQQAIVEAISRAGCDLNHVKAIFTGIAGFDSEEDLEWVEGLTDVSGLNSGTGSIIFAITEDETQIRNYDLHHYAASAARFLSYDAVFEILAGNTTSSDNALIQQVFSHWSVEDLSELRKLALHGFIEDRRERDRMFGQMAPFITAAAQQDSFLAQIVCDRAINQISVGIEMLSAYFKSNTVSVTLIGSVINSPYMKQSLAERLYKGNNKKYIVVEPALSAVSGAVMMALKRLDVFIDHNTVQNIQKHPYSKYIL